MSNRAFFGGLLIGVGYLLNNRKIMKGETFSANEGEYMAEEMKWNELAKDRQGQRTLALWNEGQKIINYFTWDEFIMFLGANSAMQESPYGRNIGNPLRLENYMGGRDAAGNLQDYNRRPPMMSQEQFDALVEEKYVEGVAALKSPHYGAVEDYNEDSSYWNMDEGRLWTLGETRGIAMGQYERLEPAEMVVFKVSSRPVYHKGHGKEYKRHPTYFVYDTLNQKVREVDARDDGYGGMRPPRIQSHEKFVGVPVNDENAQKVNRGGRRIMGEVYPAKDVDDSHPLAIQLRTQIENNLAERNVLEGQVKGFDGEGRLDSYARNNIQTVITALEAHLKYPKVKSLIVTGQGYKTKVKPSTKIYPNPAESDEVVKEWIDYLVETERERRKAQIQHMKGFPSPNEDYIKRLEAQLETINYDWGTQQYLHRAGARGNTVPKKAQAKKYLSQTIVDDKGWMQHLSTLKRWMELQAIFQQNYREGGTSIADLIAEKKEQLKAKQERLNEAHSDSYWNNIVQERIKAIKAGILQERKDFEQNILNDMAKLREEIDKLQS